jgi:hypothetical protein
MLNNLVLRGEGCYDIYLRFSFMENKVWILC